MRPFLLSLLLAATASAQGVGWIAGAVADADTGERLPYAAVWVDGAALAAATDADGWYSAEVPAGTYAVRVPYVGFELRERTVRVEPGRVRRLDVALEPGDVIGCDIWVPAPVALPGVYAARVGTYEGAATWCAPVRLGDPGVQHAADR